MHARYFRLFWVSWILIGCSMGVVYKECMNWPQYVQGFLPDYLEQYPKPTCFIVLTSNLHVYVNGSGPFLSSVALRKVLSSSFAWTRMLGSCSAIWRKNNKIKLTHSTQSRLLFYHVTLMLLCLFYKYFKRYFILLGFKGCGMGPWLVLVSPCFRENVVATCKIGSFLCS